MKNTVLIVVVSVVVTIIVLYFAAIVYVGKRGKKQSKNNFSQMSGDANAAGQGAIKGALSSFDFGTTNQNTGFVPYFLQK